MKVEPLNAILDPQYFVRTVHGCVLAVLRARSEVNERRSADNSGFRCSHRGPFFTQHRDACLSGGHLVESTRGAVISFDLREKLASLRMVKLEREMTSSSFCVVRPMYCYNG